ncbi:cytochrome P450 CYP82D47-like [Bidens hawaiensis]|uniref:cytochrome P450 CYP82D47-like n=1 Tax=Bidens hawaiensis TaxID=980011 RepID=UPI00404A4D3C
MDLLLLLIIFVASILCFLIFGGLKPLRNGVNKINYGLGARAPEATGSLPIIGHLHLLGGSQLRHKRLGSMAEKFGSIFTIKLGVHRVLVVSNSEMAKACLTTNDRVFASRPKQMSSDLMAYNYANVGDAPYGPYWRHIRKLIVLELASHHRAQMLAHTRVSEVKSYMVDMYKTWVRDKGSSETVMVDMKQWFGNLIVSMVISMMFGNNFARSEHDRKQFRKAIRLWMDISGVFVPSDFIPWLRWLDLGGYEKKMKKTAIEMDDVLSAWLEDQNKKMNSTSTQQVHESRHQTVFMAALLSRVKEEINEDLYGLSTDNIVKATSLAIFAGATDTTTATLTWALSLLVDNPLVLKKAQQELEKHVGRERKVEESDMHNLVYLQAIIKETMRLYPVVPLLVPHESIEDCIVGGYTVPKGTRLLLNAWKIHHDPQIWTNPFEFRPERFVTSEKDIDVKGRNFELIPFGSGRRVCLGMSFALESMQLILASIIHEFEFQNPSNEQIDMTESGGLISHKDSPLELLVAPRLSPHVYEVLL